MKESKIPSWAKVGARVFLIDTFDSSKHEGTIRHVSGDRQFCDIGPWVADCTDGQFGVYGVTSKFYDVEPHPDSLEAIFLRRVNRAFRKATRHWINHPSGAGFKSKKAWKAWCRNQTYRGYGCDYFDSWKSDNVEMCMCQHAVDDIVLDDMSYWD